MAIESDMRLASSWPNSRSALPAPSTTSTRHPRSRSADASGSSGALPYPPPTSAAFTAVLGSRNGRPSGPTTSSSSPCLRRLSHWVPLPWAAKTNSTVPP